jgi:RNA polymerase primary sigma factor
MDDQQREAELLRRGRKQGVVSYDDILELFPNVERDLARLDAIYEMLEARDIGVGEPSNSAREQARLGAGAPLGLRESGDLDLQDNISLYLREVSRVPLLKAEDEITLAKRIETGLRAETRLAGSTRSMKPATRQALLASVQDGREARRALVRSNMRLVISIAKRYVGQGVPFLDLIQEGNLGLIKAADKFDWRRGLKFSTYATWWIRQSVTRALADQGRTIRLPVHMSDRIRQLHRITRSLEQELGREPTVDEVAERIEMSPQQVKGTIRVSQRPLSLEQPVGDEQDSELGELIAAGEGDESLEAAARELLRDDVERMLHTLSPREARILELRYGLLDGREYTLKEVGDKFGITRERIRQIENEALERLREPSRAERITEYLT